MDGAAATAYGDIQQPRAISFQRRLPGACYDALPPLRAELLEFLGANGVSGAHAARLAFTVTEVMTNLVRHPRQKASRVQVTVRLTAAFAMVDVADDSTPFASFDAKCNAARTVRCATESFAESGYGLACILRQHETVRYTPAGAGRNRLNHFRVQDRREAAEEAPMLSRMPPREDDGAPLADLLRPALPPAHAGWRITALTHAAEKAGGGDFTMHRAGADGLMAVLSDVMGHGPEAKFLSYIYAGYLRGALDGGGATPARFLESLSRSMPSSLLLEGGIMTCLAFRLGADGKASLASAGHPQPVLVRKAGAEPLGVAGPLPGLGHGGYSERTVILAPGEKIIVMTDGFTQAFSGHDRSSSEILSLLDALPPCSGKEMAAALWREYRRRPQGRLEDDATLVIAEYGGEHERNP